MAIIATHGGDKQPALSTCMGPLPSKKLGGAWPVFPCVHQGGDANLTAQLLYEKFGHNILETLRKSQHGRYLESIGLSEDLKFCSQLDFYHIVPMLRDGIISI